MARVVETGNTYYEQPTIQKVGSLKWMAPEQMERQVYSKATDVFSFGVLLFEIFAREAPWKDVNNMVACANVLKGDRMQLSRSLPRAMRQLMLECWAHESSDRPKMSVIQKRIANEMFDASSED
jgi:serine/threonine protein kinase